ncbi:MAG: hypothetical protein ACPGUV_14285 [Polyangiales bacterium]
MWPALQHQGTAHYRQAILATLHDEGRFIPSATWIDGRFALRVAITNHRSREEDFVGLVAAVVEHGRRLWRKMSCSA